MCIVLLTAVKPYCNTGRTWIFEMSEPSLSRINKVLKEMETAALTVQTCRLLHSSGVFVWEEFGPRNLRHGVGFERTVGLARLKNRKNKCSLNLVFILPDILQCLSL